MHSFYKYFYHQWIDGSQKWHPLLAVYYLTNVCDFRCPYCSNGSGTPYYRLSSSTLSGQSVISLLKKIRQHCDYVVITGGEPLNHPDFAEVMTQIGELKFKEVVLTTNGYQIDLYLPSLVSAVHSLVFSLDTLNHKKADAYFGVGKGTLAKILSNIEQAAHQINRKYDMLISSVVTPGNIEDLYAVYQYAKARGFQFAAAPQLVGVKAHNSLVANSRYQQFYDFLISEKIKGGQIFGSVLYLQYLRDLKQFSCHPFTMLVVSPMGDVFYPCLEIGHFSGNLLENNNLHVMRQAGFEKFGPQPQCGNQCHSACALGFSLALHHPVSILYEGYLTAKGKLLGLVD